MVILGFTMITDGLVGLGGFFCFFSFFPPSFSFS